jgi:hypothetical protein
MTVVKLIESQPAGALSEKVGDGYPIVLITPGHGSSGYYSEEVIRQNAPDAWPAGTHVYMDHLKEGETRSPEKLLGYLSQDTVVNESGEATNIFVPLKKHAEWVEDVRKLVGFSISASGDGHKGEVDGKETLIVESLSPHITNTVDIVSYAGRGGRFIESLFEEANHATPDSGQGKENDNMTVEELAKDFGTLKTVVESLVSKIEARESDESDSAEKLNEAKADRDAAIEAAKAVADADVTASVKEELFESIAAGDYDIAGKIERHKKLREEFLAEAGTFRLNEAGASAAGAAAASTEDTSVNGW